jgi:hydrogenase nickel incorporation protein HypB
MCATCGCSDDSPARLTDLQSGATIALSEPHDHRLHPDGIPVPNHTHPHDHDHDYNHDHPHVHEPSTITRLERDILAKNQRWAERNRGWLAGRGVLALNLVSSPGAGKTTLLERTIGELGGGRLLSVIEGDQQTLHDAERIRAAGCRVVQINTGTACHLDAAMVNRALLQLDPPAGSIVLIENVGNLVCPALFDLGEQAKVVIVSVTEGDDKPIKYPHMFRASQVMVLNKLDLLPYVRFDVDRCLDHARQVNAAIRIIQVSATRGDGLGDWYGWLRGQSSTD